MNSIKAFNKYSLYVIIILFVLPSIYLCLPKHFNSYFEVFDKLSIPIWAALYSFFWLKFSRQIKKTERQILIYKNRITSFEKIDNREYLSEYKKDTFQLSNFENEVMELKLHLEFVNETLRITVIAGALLKVIQLCYSIIF